MEKRIEEEFCQAVNRLALTHLPKSAGNFFEKHFGAVLLIDEDEINAV